MYAPVTYLLPSFILILSALGLPQPQLDTNAGIPSADSVSKVPHCAFSCPPVGNDGHWLISKVDAVGYEGIYSIFECMYAAPDAYDDAETCWYYKTSGERALSSRAVSCPAQAPPCSSSNPAPVDPHVTETHNTGPLFSKEDDKKPETPSWVETGRYMLWVKENGPILP